MPTTFGAIDGLGKDYVRVVFVVFVLVVMWRIFASVNSDLNRAEGEASTESGTVGMLILLLVGAAAVLVIGAIQQAQKTKEGGNAMLRFNEFVGHFQGMKPGTNWRDHDPRRRLHYSEAGAHPIGMAGVVMAHKPHFNMKKRGKKHDDSLDAYRHGEGEEQAREAREEYKRIRKHQVAEHLRLTGVDISEPPEGDSGGGGGNENENENENGEGKRKKGSEEADMEPLVLAVLAVVVVLVGVYTALFWLWQIMSSFAMRAA